MIKKHDILPVALLVGSLLSGCVSSTDMDESEKGTSIEFGTTMTRAAVGADKTGMQAFWVWGGFDGENNLFNAVTVSKDGHYEGTRYWVPGKMHNFYALHPAGLEVATVECTGGVITVKNFDTSKRGQDAIDLMTASKTNILYNAGEIPSAVSLTFSHALSQVIFEARLDPALHSSGVKARIQSAKLYGMSKTGTYTAQFGSTDIWVLGTPTTAENPLVQSDVKTELTDVSKPVFSEYLLLIPQELKNEFALEITYEYDDSRYADPQVFTRTIRLANATLNTWEAGKSYRYTFTVGGEYILMERPGVSDWKDATTGNISIDVNHPQV